jgi:hypothetical protein
VLQRANVRNGIASVKLSGLHCGFLTTEATAASQEVNFTLISEVSFQSETERSAALQGASYIVGSSPADARDSVLCDRFARHAPMRPWPAHQVSDRVLARSLHSCSDRTLVDSETIRSGQPALERCPRS